jgi:hypothetical protein
MKDISRIVGSDNYDVIQQWYEKVTSYEYHNKKINLTGNRLVDEYEEEEK